MDAPAMSQLTERGWGATARLVLGVTGSVFLTAVAMQPGMPIPDAVKLMIPIFVTILAAFWIALDTIRSAGGWKQVRKLRLVIVTMGSALLIGVVSYLSAVACVLLFYYMP
ncbi:hypothetical protein [Dyella koreensis]|uniref:DUF1345 domain-containing protein n=1 Tax=Dyella koreensis TaxID=311235 RepID=A0ABW8KA76_9GAMM